ncbi:hypothetical protein HPB48_008380 [Haemaphysalis longicornis]|uniref:Glucose-methanol-choline oxidoreductase N-terminal domain-containing protein n=1 Tax=Haemaphysalis longicornis TaxID=44386 RepID=A0A9J6FBJ1_HAELO|nr:hypothetical protein HPB48_008380 [Haemaphysalis longicornis]
MHFVRGNRRDYDNWSDEYGAHGWTYADVLPHFKNIETTHLRYADGTFWAMVSLEYRLCCMFFLMVTMP